MPSVSNYFFYILFTVDTLTLSNNFIYFVHFSIEATEWNKFNDEIGLPELTDDVNDDDFIGAERETSKLDKILSLIHITTLLVILCPSIL